MPIVQQGSINTTALVVPDLYVQIVPPQNLVLNGVPTNVLGIVGTASWGPANQPATVATMADYARAFGPLMSRKFDMGTHVATAVQQGASNFRCVRVTDGTDVAASYAMFYAAGAYPIELTARYTGSLGNSIGVILAAGSQAGTWRMTLILAGLTPEVFDNVPATTPAAFWTNLVAAINTGTSVLRGPSQLVVATLGTATTTAPPAAHRPVSFWRHGRRHDNHFRDPGRHRHATPVRTLRPPRPGLQPGPARRCGRHDAVHLPGGLCPFRRPLHHRYRAIR